MSHLQLSFLVSISYIFLALTSPTLQPELSDPMQAQAAQLSLMFSQAHRLQQIFILTIVEVHISLLQEFNLAWLHPYLLTTIY